MKVWVGLGGGPARGWHRQDRLTHSHTVTHKWYASRPPTPTLTPSASSCPNVVLPMPNSKGAEPQELEVPSVSAMCPAAKLVQDQALLATQPPGQPPDSHDSDTGCLRCAPRPRHGRQNHASTPPSSSCLTLPDPGILQGTYRCNSWVLWSSVRGVLAPDPHHVSVPIDLNISDKSVPIMGAGV